MEAFLTKALGVVSGNEGVIPLVIIAVIGFVVTGILSKTKALTQKQSFIVLPMLFFGVITGFIALYAVFLSAQVPSAEIEESLRDINDSNITIGGSGTTSLTKSVVGIQRSTIKIGE